MSKVRSGRRLTAPALLLGATVFPYPALADDPPSSVGPTVTQSGNVSCSTVSGTTTCTTLVSSVTPLPVSVNVSNGQNPADPQTYPLVGTITGEGGWSGSPYLFFYGSFGQPPNDTYPSETYVQGSAVTLTNSAVLTLSDASGSSVDLTQITPINSGLTYIFAAEGGGALVGYSAGGNGFPDSAKDPDVGNFDGAQGGPVTIVNDAGASLTVQGNGGGEAWLAGIGAYSHGGEGAADKTGDTDYAGNGGSGGAVTVTNDGSVAVSNSAGPVAIGIFASSIGGVGGNEKNYAAGTGGDGGTVQVSSSGSVTVAAPNGIGILAISLGGDSDFDDKDGGGDASGAGNGGSVTVEIQNGGSVSTSGGNGIGVLALSSGGAADNIFQGKGGDVQVTVDQGGSIQTAGGALSIGILAASSGSLGEILPFDTAEVNGAFPGTPGQVSVSNNGSVSTSGTMAVGILALSVGGSSIVTNASGTSTLGNVASGYSGVDGDTASVANAGSVTTSGSASYGIVAMSVGGGGGLLNQLGSGQSSYVGSNTSDSDGANAAGVTVTHSGSVVTGGAGGQDGAAAIGIVAQSVGGGGGSSNAPAVFVGGNDTAGSGGGDGGTVQVTTSGSSSVATNGDFALGILAQSVGGGGGNGANAGGLFVAVGGAGGKGGTGGEVTVTLDNAGQGSIVTRGDFAGGVLAQSVGGGGGNGGGATTVNVLVSASIGGTGGAGGDGGTVSLINDTTVVTAGNQSFGLLGQSIGGGGGSGGASNAYDLGVLTAAISVGGGGGSAGDGGAVTIDNSYHVYTGCSPAGGDCSYADSGGSVLDGADAIGILAQSVGGGGGNGGAATAKSLGLPSDEIPSFTFDFAIGGDGGGAGSGAAVAVNNAGQVFTAGDGAYGILAQSIGGAGGNAGDSTAAAYAIEGVSAAIKLSVAVGGTGGGGGSGGEVTVVNGAWSGCEGCNGEVATFGQNAAGIVAQSIAGGGGTGGSGNASASSPNLGGTTGTSITASIGVGGSGGSGEAAGAVSVTNDAGSSIATAGSGSQGILAQSIGGGGGLAGGGQAGASGDNYEANLSIGGSGGAGNDGGSVTVLNQGTIRTGGSYTNAAGITFATGGDGVGILAQSIGGGGGVGGSSDAAATVDAEDQVEDALNAPSQSYSADVSIGGRGGAGGDGDTVEVGNDGSIATWGIRAHGVMAQSIGGGGGSGGAATSASNAVLKPGEKSGTYSADLSIGGTGSAGGNGGTVEVGNEGAVQTAGYAAHALLAQSIGGGGGAGAEGSVDNTSSLGVGGGLGGFGAAGGNGGSVTVENGGSLVTAGDDAYAVLAQSIGGGGGLASAGCSNSAAVGALNVSASLCLGASGVGVTTSQGTWTDSSDFTLTVGGQAGSYGNSSTVTVEHLSGSIVTGGARAMGIVAQSIGAGGGLAAAAVENLGGGASLSTGGPGNAASIALTVGTAGAAAGETVITTYGDGAFGILAQAIGGGGGHAGDSSLDLVVGTANNLTSGPFSSDTSNGGDITLDLNAVVTTSGENAHGVFLQSLGAGGGTALVDGGLQAGNVAGSQSMYYGGGGGITVTQEGGAILAQGEGAIGLFAQSSGNNPADQNAIEVTVGGTIQGGSGAGAVGIRVSGGVSSGSSAYGGGLANAIAVTGNGWVGTADGVAGMAIQASDSVTNVTNAGTIVGSIDLGSGNAAGADPGSILNDGTFESGGSVVAWNFTNAGLLAVAGKGAIGTTGFETTAYAGTPGNFVSTGTLAVDIDALAGQTADLLTVSEAANVGGTILPSASNLLPGSYTLVTAGSLTASATVDPTLLFAWGVETSGTTLSIVPTATLTPAGVTLSGNEAAVAGHLQAAWNAGGSSELAPLFGMLSGLQSGGDYAASLSGLSGESQASHASDQALASRDALDAAFSCPVFEGDGTRLGETECAWSKVSGGITDRRGGSDYRLNEMSFRIGAQKELAPGWFLGASGAYGVNWSRADAGDASSNGQTLDGGVALKRIAGPWHLGAGLDLGYGWYDNSRTVTLPGGSQSLESDSSVLTVAGRLRAAYQVAFQDWYLKPYADLDVIWSHAPGYSETGPAGLALDVESSDETTLAISPMLELGGRLEGRGGWTFRPYAAAGLVVLTNDRWSSEASLRGAPDSAGSFTVESEVPNLLGRLDLGLQVFAVGRLEGRLEYGLQAGQDYLSQAGGARLSWRF